MLSKLASLTSTRLVAISAIALTVGLSACQNTANAPSGTTGGEASPAAQSGSNLQARLSGAGATFPAPLYQRWFAEYNKTNPGVQISYQSVGSGAGVKQFIAQTVDFGASDAPLTDEEKSQIPAEKGAMQVPMVGGAVVFAYNLPGVDDLKLSREAYCGIVQGEITKWNDPKIAAENAGATLPDRDISFIHRSDGSGTTFIFTNHIDEACPNWSAGSGKSIEWPVGIGGKGNEGVTAQVKQVEGAIGYVEYAYANENDLSMASLQNKAGQFVAPTPGAAAKATEGAEIPADFALLIPDPTGQDAYPIIGLTWLLLYEKYDDPAKAQALKEMIQWALGDGKQYAEQLGYAPLSPELATKVTAALEKVQVAQAAK
ncbi:phosphate ABC transporter substrate-binding protein PstS [Geitlerinema sp. PCC 7407]|uniref:phosphate ABC transporter substrate-binding protein PstS n=1 Tax=Geitlerinema sp. PCC 7407 TaxID=1173025 RepID=UPI00029FC06A|nr:phosphate ABC transporter substrate-binding protein PstS [Geitlerinema sp. PCC 7407]AFY64748.1 phosphate ABC transporter substrate-binding protein, PhoT family [Geitlerinema sp. PCC 7407]